MSGRQRVPAAWTQTLFLVAMNGAGIAWGGGEIPDPAALIIHNLVFLALVWTVALRRRRAHQQHVP
jgi:hypothetical protein